MGRRGVWRWGGGERLYTYRYTVTTRMTYALRWAAMRAILMFHNCEGQSRKTVFTDHTLWSERRAEADSNRGHSAYQPNTLPLGQTVSPLRMYLWWSLRTLYLLACQVRVTVGDSGLCCCTCVTSFERLLISLCVDLVCWFSRNNTRSILHAHPRFWSCEPPWSMLWRSSSVSTSDWGNIYAEIKANVYLLEKHVRFWSARATARWMLAINLRPMAQMVMTLYWITINSMISKCISSSWILYQPKLVENFTSFIACRLYIVVERRRVSIFFLVMWFAS